MRAIVGGGRTIRTACQLIGYEVLPGPRDKRSPGPLVDLVPIWHLALLRRRRPPTLDFAVRPRAVHDNRLAARCHQALFFENFQNSTGHFP